MRTQTQQNLVAITGTKLVRDINNLSLINRDARGLEDYNRKRSMLLAQRDEINNLKKDVSEIKEMLLKLIGKNNG